MSIELSNKLRTVGPPCIGVFDACSESDPELHAFWQQNRVDGAFLNRTCLESPTLVEDWHRRNVEAGADWIRTLTADLIGPHADESPLDRVDILAVRRACRLAANVGTAAKVRVAGALRPYRIPFEGNASPIDWDVPSLSLQKYCDGIRAFLDEGVTTLSIEGAYSIREAEISLLAVLLASRGRTTPIVSMTGACWGSPFLLHGDPLETFLACQKNERTIVGVDLLWATEPAVQQLLVALRGGPPRRVSLSVQKFQEEPRIRCPESRDRATAVYRELVRNGEALVIGGGRGEQIVDVRLNRSLANGG